MITPWQTQVALLHRIAFDSNALIYFLENREPYANYVAQVFAILERGVAVGFVSTIVELELLVKPMREGDFVIVDKVELFFRETPHLSVRPVDRVVARRAANIRARTGLPPPDAIIVATALEERCDAIIGNDHAIASRLTGVPYLCLDDYI